MKKVFILSIAAVLGLTACNQRCIEASGRQVTQTRTVGTFSEIESGGDIRLILRQDSTQKLTITADENLQKYIDARVSGERLIIEMEGNTCNSGPIIVNASAKMFKGFRGSGSVELVGEGPLKVNDFLLELSGDSKVNLDLNAANVRISSSGATEMTLKGQARSNSMELSGAGEINAFDFAVADYNIQTSGASNCKINVLNELNVESSGASEIQYKGNPKRVNNNQSGASSVKKVE